MSTRKGGEVASAYATEAHGKDICHVAGGHGALGPQRVRFPSLQSASTAPATTVRAGGGGGGWHKASVSDCLPLAAPIGLSSLLILSLCGPERVLVVSMEPLDDLSCLTTPESAVPETGCCPCR